MLDLVKIGEKIQELRQQHGYSQTELANKLYVSHQAVSRWETGKSLPAIETLLILSTLFKTSIDTLLCLNIPLEDDLETLFKKHSRLYVISEVLKDKHKNYTIDDIWHLLSQEERYYVIKHSLEQNLKLIERMFTRFSFEERRMILNSVKCKNKELLSNLYVFFTPFEKRLLKKEGLL